MTDRNAGVGPFTVARDIVTAQDGEGPRFVQVSDALGQRFALVNVEDCHGGDMPAAKARAQRIAESLNQTEGHAKPAPYIDEQGNLRAPAGYCFVANGEGCEMVPLVSITVSPAS